MKKSAKIFLAMFLVLVFATWAIGQSQLRQGVSTPKIYYQDSAGWVGSYYFTVPTLTANDTLVGRNTTDTLTNKTLTSPTITTPVITSPDATYGIASVHNYAAAADWEMSTSEAKLLLLTTSSGNATANIIAPDVSGRLFVVRNARDYNVVIKKSGGTGVTIASNKTAVVIHNGSDYIRVTADQTH